MRYFASAILIFIVVLSAFSQRQVVTLSEILTTKGFNDKVFFSGNKEGIGTELLVTNGSPGYVEVVKDINAGPAGSMPENFTIFNGQLYFTAYAAGQSYRGLWKTDGTAAGTQQVYFEQYSNVAKLTVFKNKLYFTTNLGRIIRTDGANTEVFFQSDYTSSNIPVLLATEEYLYFTPYAPVFYRSDGITVTDFPIAPSSEELYFRNLFVIGNTLIAVKATTYDETVRLYALDNADIGSGNEETDWKFLRELKAPFTRSQYVGNFTVVNNKLFFSYRTYFDVVPPSDELWVCDGTVEGTKMLKSFLWQPHSSGSEMRQFFSFQNKLFFRNGFADNTALWTSDGTETGTTRFHAVQMALPGYQQPTPLFVTENKFYFSSVANDLWSSDGTAANTRQIFTLEGANSTMAPHHFTMANNILYTVTKANFSSTLWSTAPDADISVTYNGNSIFSGVKSAYLISSFRGVNPGSCKTSNLMITNKGLAPLYFSDILVTGNDFYLIKQALPEMLAPAASLTLQVMFNPVVNGLSYGRLTLVSNDSDEPQFEVPLEGNTESFSSTGSLCLFTESEYVKSLKSTIPLQPVVLSASTITEASPIGTVVGEFSLPADATFSFATGEGDADNNQFMIEGNKLKSAVVFDRAVRTVYTVRVKAVTPSETSEASFRIRVLNAVAGFVADNCSMTVDRISFSYTSLATNAQGYLFATTSDGKIVRSKDSGNSWHPVYERYYSTSLKNIMFFGETGYAISHSTLLKSEDDGETWFANYIPSNGEYGLSDFDAYFFNAQEGYLGTNQGEVFYTSDGGRSWELRISGWWRNVRSLWFTSKTSGFASVDFGTLYKTSDGGRIWTEVDLSAIGFSPYVYDMVFLNEQSGLMTTNRGLCKTTNGGQSWALVPSAPTGYQVEFVDANTGFMYGDFTTLSRTTDGGNTWNYVLDVPGNPITGIAKSGNKLYCVSKDYYQSYDAERMLAVSSDAGNTWAMISNFTHKSLYRMKFTTGGRGLITGEDGIMETRDNGLSWKKPVTDLASIADFLFLDDNNMILVSMGQIYKSNDGGATTRKVLNAPNNLEQEPYLPAGKLYNFDGILYAVSWYAVYRSTDEGETWLLASTNVAYYTQGMHFVSATVGYRVELFGDIQKTTNSGTTWTQVYNHSSEAADPYNAIFFVNEQRGYKGGRYLEQTTDGGVTWQRIHNQWYDDIIMIHFETEAHGFVVTRAGYAYETQDSGLTWQTIFGPPSSTRLFNAEVINHEIMMVGEYGFAARISSSTREADFPGYIYGPASVCAGATVEYRLKTDYQTQWSTTADHMNDQADRITVKFPEAGEYTISARHFNVCSISEVRVLTVVVSEPVAPELQGPDAVHSGAEDVAYTITNATEGSRFLWEVTKGVGNTLDNDRTLMVDWTNTFDTGRVGVLAIDNSGCRVYASLNVGIGVILSAEDDLLNRVNIYPNPTEGDTKVYSTYSGDLLVRIIDVMGKEYDRGILTRDGEKVLPTKALPSGLYFVELSNGQHTVSRKLIRK